MKRVIKFLLPTNLLAFLAGNVINNWHLVLEQWSAFNILPFTLCFLLMLSIYPEGSVGWYIILRKINVDIRFKNALKIWIISNTSRYIPGKIWQYLGRIELARREGIPRTKTFASLLIEVFLVLIAGIIVSVFSLSLLPLKEIDQWWMFLIIVPFLLLHPIFSNKIIDIVSKLSRKDFGVVKVNLSFRDTILSLPWFILNFFINGLALFFLISSVSHNFAPSSIIAISGFYALSWVLGYISFFAPGGIGVTEVSLAYLLSTIMPFALASLVAILYRFLLTAAEFLVFIMVLRIKDNQ